MSDNNKKSFCLQPSQFKLDGGAMYGIIPKPLWEKKSPPDELNRIQLSLRLWLMQAGDKLILVDTGVGDFHDSKFVQQFAVQGPQNPLQLALRSLGFSPEQVTDLIITHLHFDHVGGIGQKNPKDEWIPCFPQATLHLHQKHYTYSQNPTDRDRGSFWTKDYEPIIEFYRQRSQIHWLTADEGLLIQSQEGKALLSYVCSHGHTPHLIHPYDEQFIYLADIIPTAHHVRIPWVMGYDIAPGVSTQDKKRILSFVCEKNLTVIFEHDPQYWGGRIEWDDSKGFVIQHLYPHQPGEAYQISDDR